MRHFVEVDHFHQTEVKRLQQTERPRREAGAPHPLSQHVTSTRLLRGGLAGEVKDEERTQRFLRGLVRGRLIGSRATSSNSRSRLQ